MKPTRILGGLILFDAGVSFMSLVLVATIWPYVTTNIIKTQAYTPILTALSFAKPLIEFAIGMLLIDDRSKEKKKGEEK